MNPNSDRQWTISAATHNRSAQQLFTTGCPTTYHDRTSQHVVLPKSLTNQFQETILHFMKPLIFNKYPRPPPSNNLLYHSESGLIGLAVETPPEPLFWWQLFFHVHFGEHFVSLRGHYWIDLGHFFVTCWTTEQKFPVWGNRCPSAAVCLFLSTLRHVRVFCFSQLVMTLLVTRAGTCFRPRFCSI